MRILLPYHLGSGNRGCEGIARGIANIMKLKKNQFILFDISPYDYEEDSRLELNKIGELRYTKQSKVVEVARLVSRVLQKMRISFFYNQVMSSYYVSYAKTDDVIFITGGDIYCYEGTAELPNLIVKKAKKEGIKTVLFGVSMEEKFLTKEVVNGLKNYDLIITRETISAKTMAEAGLSNYLYPDPAFSLKPLKCSLPEYFDKDVVGVNFSPFTDIDELFKENMNRLIDYILLQGMEVCFIPHVFWKEQDDRRSIAKYMMKYGNRIHVLDSEKMSYLQIRYAISKCKYFVGGRTHSVISAYSTHVPCIALGYSVKARGIAGDIGMPEYTVIDSKHLKSRNDLLDAFMKLEESQVEIMQIYKGMDSYIKQIDGLRQLVLR
ncbi:MULTISPECIES: polysaccharide pyruvyl transferase family protein [Blautia]|uniref:polysaccharide pyruvyl transferase family protein n=1 Tax=Blautia TaxID=572511 RepID=UPI000BA2C410|nr:MULTISPECIES: polysaccharide pyruvyl transferase family protein [Blautia]